MTTQVLKLVYELLPSDVICFLSGCPRGRLIKYVTNGHMRPYKRGKGKRPHMWSVRQCLARAGADAVWRLRCS